VDAAQPALAGEPRINHWLSSRLPNQSNVLATVRWPNDTNNVVSLAELGMPPLQLTSVFAFGVESGSQIHNVVLARASSLRPDGVPSDTLPELDLSAVSEAAGNAVSFATFASALEQFSLLLANSRNLQPQELASDDEVVETNWVVEEVEGRANHISAALTQLHDDMDNALLGDAGKRALVQTAFAFRISEAAPTVTAVNEAALQNHFDQVRNVVTGRVVQISKLEAGFDAEMAGTEGVLAHHTDRLKAALGKDYPVSVSFLPGNVAELHLAWESRKELVGTTSPVVTNWVRQSARVRPGVETFNDALRFAAAYGDDNAYQFDVLQLPFSAGDRWAGLPFEAGQRPGNPKTSVIVHGDLTVDDTAPVAALMVDSWVETIPAQSQDTAVAFHFDQPASRAPNTVLLAVPPNDSAWTPDTLLQIVSESLELAKLRTVDLTAIPELGHFLPALMFATNEFGDTITLDIERATAPRVEIDRFIDDIRQEVASWRP